MARKTEFGSFVRGFVTPLLLVLIGGGMLTLTRFVSIPFMGITGIALIAIGVIWIIISCFLDGIDIFDS